MELGHHHVLADDEHLGEDVLFVQDHDGHFRVRNYVQKLQDDRLEEHVNALLLRVDQVHPFGDGHDEGGRDGVALLDEELLDLVFVVVLEEGEFLLELWVGVVEKVLLEG